MSRIDLTDIYCLTNKGNIYELTPVLLLDVKKVGSNYYIKSWQESDELGSVEYLEEKITMTSDSLFGFESTSKYKTIPIWILRNLLTHGTAMVNKNARKRIDFKALEEFNYSVFMESDKDNCVKVYAKKIILEKGSVFDHVDARH